MNYFNLYQYNLTDHLGNSRFTFNSSGAKLQSDDYYPFGKTFNSFVLVNRNNYLYNGKELQYGLEQYDYGARFYDPVIGRFTTVDKLADHPLQINASPYAYTGNNPISRVDPDGNCWPCLVVVIEALTVSELVAAGGAIIGTAVVMNSMNQFKNSNNSSYFVQDGTKGPKVVLTPVAQSKESNIKKESVVNGVKAKLAPDKDAGGDHSAFKTDKDGKTTGTATYEKNPQNPSGFDEVKRVDVTGKPHYDKKTGKEIPTPHVK